MDVTGFYSAEPFLSPLTGINTSSKVKISVPHSHSAIYDLTWSYAFSYDHTLRLKWRLGDAAAI